MRRRSAAAGLGALAALLLLAPGVRADDYSDPDYAAYDLDNMARTLERQERHATSPDYWQASQETFTETFLAGMERQARDLDEGRVYAGGGQLLPGGNVGDPEHYHEGDRHLVELIGRDGSKLVGNVWPCVHKGRAKNGCPSVVVTTGSIQVTQHMYGWLARHLQANGYTVMTYDVRGQGESESTTHPGGDPFPRPANPQDGASFVNGTVDALRFLLSTPQRPYVPVGFDAQPEAAGVTPHNPAWKAVDPGRLALIGHSLGASAVSTVQQCSDAYPERVLPDVRLPAGCAGQRFAIRAIVAYDSLSAPEGRLVPAFDHRADGYFVNAVPTTRAPSPDERTGPSSPFGRFRESGLDACSITVRGGTHAEWSQIPYIVSATRYGVPQARHYTLAWLDRHVSGDAERERRGFEALRDGPVPQEPAGEHLDHRASLFSGKYRSACHVTDPAGGPAFSSSDLRAHAGVAAVGDWAALNAEDEHGVVRDG
jgi:hypothetical protein